MTNRASISDEGWDLALAYEAARLSFRAGGSVDDVTGFVLSESEGACIFARFENFQFSALMVVNADAVLDIERDEVTAFFQDVVTVLGTGTVVLPKEMLAIGSVLEAANFARERSAIVVLEGFEEEEFDVVKVFGTGEKGAMLRVLSPDGQWSQRSTWLKTKDIACLSLLDRYCMSLEAYFAHTNTDQ